MEKDEAEEVRELLAFEENTAGSMMTTEYVVVHESATVEGAIEALRNFEGQVEAIHQIYLIDNDAVLKGAVPYRADCARRRQHAAAWILPPNP
jgi:magnesium transporter